jgi:hypothetical protein
MALTDSWRGMLYVNACRLTVWPKTGLEEGRTMKKLAVFALAMLVGVSLAQAAQDRLVFADLGGIRNFRPDGVEGIYIEGRNHRWYHASFMAPCHELKFQERVGFVLEPTGDLYRFSSILVGDEQCRFKSFERTEEPE